MNIKNNDYCSIEANQLIYLYLHFQNKLHKYEIKIMITQILTLYKQNNNFRKKIGPESFQYQSNIF